MKLLASLLALTVGAFVPALASQPVFSQTSTSTNIVGTWQGFATRDTQRIPITIKISGSGNDLHAAFINGPAEHPDETLASSVTFDGTHLVASFNYFARKIDATLDNGTLTGTYGAAKPPADKPGARVQAPTPFTVNPRRRSSRSRRLARCSRHSRLLGDRHEELQRRVCMGVSRRSPQRQVSRHQNCDPAHRW